MLCRTTSEQEDPQQLSLPQAFRVRYAIRPAQLNYRTVEEKEIYSSSQGENEEKKRERVRFSEIPVAFFFYVWIIVIIDVISLCPISTCTLVLVVIRLVYFLTLFYIHSIFIHCDASRRHQRRDAVRSVTRFFLQHINLRACERPSDMRLI